MGQHPRWASVAVEEALDVRAAFERAWADGVVSPEEAAVLEREIAEAVHAAEVTDLTDLALDELRRTGGLTPYTRRRAQRLGLEVAVLVPASEQEAAS